MSPEEYETVRRDSRRFVVAPGHEAPGIEDVVERTDRFRVVQKHEDVRDVVEETDRRRFRRQM